MRRPGRGEAGEREPAGRDEGAPCRHDPPYFSAAAFSGETYQITTW